MGPKKSLIFAGLMVLHRLFLIDLNILENKNRVDVNIGFRDENPSDIYNIDRYLTFYFQFGL